jgi:hypothetical protein
VKATFGLLVLALSLGLIKVCRLVVLLILLSSHQAFARTEVDVRPANCVGEAQGCQVNLTVRWQNDEPVPSCLLISALNIKKCTQPGSKGHFNKIVSIKKSIVIRVVSQHSGKELDATKFEVYSAVTRKRHRHAWSILQ